jgi:hypothetical protein
MAVSHLSGRPSARSDLAEFYAAALADQAARGMSIADYAEELGVTAATLYSWRRRLGGAPAKAAPCTDPLGLIEVKMGDTGLPMADLNSVDQRRGRGRGYQRAALGKSSGADLGDGDRVAVPLMLDGDYEVVVLLHARGRRQVVSRSIGVVSVSLDSPQRGPANVPVPAQLIQEALLELGS